MHLDIVDLRSFYAGPLGSVVRRVLAQRIRGRWRNVGGMQLMGLGFAVPYIGLFRGEAACLGALMPANQGALVWPGTGNVHTVMVDEALLPLADASVDRMLGVHCLEVSERAGALLREMWRVLTPEGRLLLVVPNRRSMWARFDTTPFGHGRPYSRGQLERLLKDSLFTPLEWSGALYMPPLDRYWLVRWATGFERIGARLWPGFAGVIIVEARKELMGALPAGAAARRAPRLVPVNGIMRRE
ncbi:MAG: methyltransferase domain-containing protein [Hyphomicrobiaceae bacterium]|nr:MAG: methyltransferase domain-containing protein [Hyphomicrobiaceae bacterium]